MKISLIDTANEKVSVFDVLRSLDVWLPDVEGRPFKVRCPWGPTAHPDGGAAAAMKVFPDSNSAYCFQCSAKETPVSLWAKANDLRHEPAAMQLLDQIGYRPLDAVARWDQALAHVEPVDRFSLAEALKVYCLRMEREDWDVAQFEPEVSDQLDACLGLLDLVVTPEEARTWLHRTKKAMRLTLEERRSHAGQP